MPFNNKLIGSVAEGSECSGLARLQTRAAFLKRWWARLSAKLFFSKNMQQELIKHSLTLTARSNHEYPKWYSQQAKEGKYTIEDKSFSNFTGTGGWATKFHWDQLVEGVSLQSQALFNLSAMLVNNALDPGFQVLNSIRSLMGFHISRAVFPIPKPGFQIPQSGFPYMGR